MVAEGLSGMMRQTVFLHLFEGFKVGTEVIEVSLLQFADDTLFIGEPNIQNVLVMKSVLRCFELMSGLKVNFSKSKLAGVAMQTGMIRRLVMILNCMTVEIPFVYLGIPVEANP